MKSYISVNVKKYKATARLNALIGENYRNEESAQRYDNGKRVLDTERTVDNVYLLGRPDDYDQMRRERIDAVNSARSARGDISLHLKHNKERLKQDGKLSSEVAATRKLRSDTVDTLGLVVQPSADFINGLNRDEQIQFFADALAAMQARPDYYGEIQTAVVHMDESTPHMQCLASAINTETLSADAKKIVGNKSKMSDRQTLLAQDMQAKGWSVKRGLKRVDNPEYRNFRDDMIAAGLEVNRHNDAILLEQWQRLKVERAGLEQLQQDGLSAQRKGAAALDAAADASRQLKQSQEILSARSAALDSREESVKRAGLLLQGKKQELDARENALNARERSLSARDEELSEREQKWLKTQNTALQAVDALNGMLSKGLRLTESRKRQVHEILKQYYPVSAEDAAEGTADNLRDLQDALQQLAAGSAGLSL